MAVLGVTSPRLKPISELCRNNRKCAETTRILRKHPEFCREQPRETLRALTNLFSDTIILPASVDPLPSTNIKPIFYIEESLFKLKNWVGTLIPVTVNCYSEIKQVDETMVELSKLFIF
jgi:hypothetical protein